MPEGIFRAGNFELRQLILISSSGMEVDLTAACMSITIFESIDQQKQYIKDTIINSEKYLKDNLDESYKIMNIITLNE